MQNNALKSIHADRTANCKQGLQFAIRKTRDLRVRHSSALTEKADVLLTAPFARLVDDQSCARAAGLPVLLFSTTLLSM